MRTAAFAILFFVAFGYAAKSQRFSLLPQVGFENLKTNISYNSLNSFAPIGVKFTPQAGLRLTYSSSLGHGFFLGVASNRSVVSFSFADPETGMNDYTATAGNMQLRLEGGYQFNSKPILLSRTSKASSIAEQQKSAKCNRGNCHRSCSSAAGHCGGNSRMKQPMLSRNKGSWLRIQPSVGMAYIPASKTTLGTKPENGRTVYEYRAGNWNTALIAGAGFEFGRKNTRLFTVSLNYVKGLGNLGTQSISTQAGAKSITTDLKSSVSGWNLKVGIPFTLKKNTASNRSHQCHQYRPACSQYRIIYRCTN